MNNMKKYGQGLSLVEVMVSLVIGMIILAGIFSVYLSNSQSFRFNSQLSRLQENGRFALSLIENDVRMAAYAGCAKMSLDDPEYNPAEDIDVAATVGVTNAQWVQGVVVPDSRDKLTIYGVPMENGAIYVHYSCGEVTKINKVSGTSSENPVPVQVDEVVYEHDSANKILKRKVGAGTPAELIDNVEDFKITYGVDRFGAAATEPMNETIVWKLPSEVTSDVDKKRITAVRVELTLKSAEPVFLKEEATDTYLYKTFRSTVTLRNKVPNGYGVCDGGSDDSSRCGDENP